jgi:hypothetical protein
VLHDSHEEDHIHLKSHQRFPSRCKGLAVETRRKGDEQRLFEKCCSKLAAGRPQLQVVERDRRPTRRVVRGHGRAAPEASRSIGCSQQYKVDARHACTPRDRPIARPFHGTAEGHHRHKKQSRVAPGSSARCCCASSRWSVAPVSSSSTSGQGWRDSGRVHGRPSRKGVRQCARRRRDRRASRCVDLRVIGL